jgi:hypothetical protein
MHCTRPGSYVSGPEFAGDFGLLAGLRSGCLRREQQEDRSGAEQLDFDDGDGFGYAGVCSSCRCAAPTVVRQ